MQYEYLLKGTPKVIIFNRTLLNLLFTQSETKVGSEKQYKMVLINSTRQRIQFKLRNVQYILERKNIKYNIRS